MMTAVAEPAPTNRMDAPARPLASPYYPQLLSRPVPRYTSFPTAVEFPDGVTAADYARALDAV